MQALPPIPTAPPTAPASPAVGSTDATPVDPQEALFSDVLAEQHDAQSSSPTVAETADPAQPDQAAVQATDTVSPSVQIENSETPLAPVLAELPGPAPDEDAVVVEGSGQVVVDEAIEPATEVEVVHAEQGRKPGTTEDDGSTPDSLVEVQPAEALQLDESVAAPELASTAAATVASQAVQPDAVRISDGGATQVAAAAVAQGSTPAVSPASTRAKTAPTQAAPQAAVVAGDQQATTDVSLSAGEVVEPIVGEALQQNVASDRQPVQPQQEATPTAATELADSFDFGDANTPDLNLDEGLPQAAVERDSGFDSQLTSMLDVTAPAASSSSNVGPSGVSQHVGQPGAIEESGSVSGQVTDHLVKARQSIEDGKAKLEVQLDPPELGKLTIEVVEENDRLSAKMVLAENTTLDAVRSVLPDLLDSLQDAGLSFDDLELQYSPNAERDDESSSNSAGNGGEQAPTEDTAAAGTLQSMLGTSRVNVLI